MTVTGILLLLKVRVTSQIKYCDNIGLYLGKISLLLPLPSIGEVDLSKGLIIGTFYAKSRLLGLFS